MEVTRRDMMKIGLAGAAVATVPLQRWAWTALNTASRLPESQLPEPFQVPFAVPPVLDPVKRDRTTDYYKIVQKRARLEIIPGLKTIIWGYNGMTPGPTIKVRRGRKSVVRQINRLGGDVHTSTHLHGSASMPQFDGYAEDVTHAGFAKDYRYPNFQNARTIWYHDHGIHQTSRNAYRGLAGMYIIHDRRELDLPIPHGRYDNPLVLKDALFSNTGSLIFDDGGHSSLMGDVVLVNGRPWPRMKVERRKYRFRILNASVSRGYDLALSTGDDFTLIATDAGLIHRPVRLNHLRVGMAERYEIVIDFSKFKIGDRVVLENLGLPNNIDYPSTRNVMRFDVVREPTSRANNAIPDVLAPRHEAMTLTDSDAVKQRSFDLIRQNGMWTINGKIWNKSRVDANPAFNSVEKWTFRNSSSGWFHPLHIHLVDFRVLTRNGGRCEPWEVGPKDVVYLGEGDEVELVMRFEHQKGKYMFHCHNLVHEDHDMMSQFEVGHGGPDPMSARAKRIK